MDTWRLFVLPLLCFGAVSGTGSFAEQKKETCSFLQARDLIITHNAGLKSASTQAEAAQAGTAQAGVLPNPGINISLERFGANELEATIEQAVALGGKRRIRIEAAQKEVDAATATRNYTHLELDAEIIRRFIPIASNEKKASLLDSIILLAESAKEQLQQRVDAGAAKKVDVIRAEIDGERLRVERSRLTRDNRLARRRFAALGGVNDDLLLQTVTGNIVGHIDLPPLDDLRRALNNNPQLKMIDIKQEQLRLQGNLFRAEMVPDLFLSAGYLRNNIDHSNAPLVGLSMTVPLFNRTTAAQKQLELECQALSEQRKNIARLLDADVQDLYARVVEINMKIATLSNSTIKKAETVYSLLQEYYASGNAGYLDLSAAQSEMFSLRMDLLDLQTERALICADLLQTTTLPIKIVN